MKEIPLTQGKVALVDDADFEWLSQWKWHLAARPFCRRVKFYATAWDGDEKILMHRKILGLSGKQKADHKDADGLNNQRHNLRTATNADNCRNKSWNPHSSKFKGVNWCRARNYWQSGIKVNYKLIHLGCFDDETDAAVAYNKAAIFHFGEFAKLNPIPEGWIFTPPRIWKGGKCSRNYNRANYNYEQK